LHPYTLYYGTRLPVLFYLKIYGYLRDDVTFFFTSHASELRKTCELIVDVQVMLANKILQEDKQHLTFRLFFLNKSEGECALGCSTNAQKKSLSCHFMHIDKVKG